MTAEKTRVVRRRGTVTDLLIGKPLPQCVQVPQRYRAAVTALVDHPAAKNRNIGRYLRYNLIANKRWAIEDAKSILDGTYPWNQYGVSVDDEGHLEGPDCLIIDGDQENWDLIDPCGAPTIDLKANAEPWDETGAFDDKPLSARRRPDLEICITVLAPSDKSLLNKLKGTQLGWNLRQSKSTRRQPHPEFRHAFFSGRAVLTEPEIGVLVCRILPTDRYDPERLLALMVGALHRWLHDVAHSITVQYMRSAMPESPRRKPRNKR